MSRQIRVFAGISMAAVVVPATIAAAASVLIGFAAPARCRGSEFRACQPFYSPSHLPFQAPPFDRIKDSDYRPAIEAGMARQRAEIAAIAGNSVPPTFENTLLAMEKSGFLLDRAEAAFGAVSEANTNPALQAVKAVLAPKLAAHHDAIYLDEKLFARIASIYERRDSLKLDPESRRLVELTYDEFVRSGANLSPADKSKLEKLNAESSILSNTFTTQVLAATQKAAFQTSSPTALTGLSDAQVAAAAQAAKGRKVDGYVLTLAEHDATARIGGAQRQGHSARCFRQVLDAHRAGRRERHAPNGIALGAAACRAGEAAGVCKSRRLETRGPDGENP